MVIASMEHVTKMFKDFKALNDVSIEIESGKIYGLIGQNGAGKTTLMRILCGFSKATSGEVTLFGEKEVGGREKKLKKVSCLIEYPGLIPEMTARQNLHYHCLLRGIKNQERVEEVLALVGLFETNNKQAKDFSLGMKQRLGIAITLLNQPEFLVLDEPINGLDPVGVVEIRNLLKNLCIKQELSLQELEEYCRHHIKIKCENISELKNVLNNVLNTSNYEMTKDGMVCLYDYVDEVETVAKAIFEAGMYPTHLSKDGETLENYFLSVIGGENK